jgi:hypothetical protein
MQKRCEIVGITDLTGDGVYALLRPLNARSQRCSHVGCILEGRRTLRLLHYLSQSNVQALSLSVITWLDLLQKDHVWSSRWPVVIPLSGEITDELMMVLCMHTLRSNKFVFCLSKHSLNLALKIVETNNNDISWINVALLAMSTHTRWDSYACNFDRSISSFRRLISIFAAG